MFPTTVRPGQIFLIFDFSAWARCCLLIPEIVVLGDDRVVFQEGVQVLAAVLEVVLFACNNCRHIHSFVDEQTSLKIQRLLS